MRQVAMAVAAVLVLALISPAFAQPFADTPTNHWAYDAIAELAAKGLIEGYPDGTFKGDRAMTRYEMAMVVARLLARIESIQIPTPAPPPKPEVTKADIDMILRLVNEFRAELAAKNVRLTAVEEELNAIKAKLDNVRITGRFRWRYDGSPSAANNCSVPLGTTTGCTAANFTASSSVNGNPNTGITAAADKAAVIFRSREGFKLQMDGSVAPSIHAILGVEVSSQASSTPFTFNSSAFRGSYDFANIVDLFLDWKNVFGTPLEIWLGRFGGGQQGFATYPVQFGPNGLLMASGGDPYTASTFGGVGHAIDGLRVAGKFPEVWDLQVQGLIWRVGGASGSGTYELGEDAFGLDANIQIIPGLRAGAYYVGNSVSQGGVGVTGTPGPFYHLYGNPGTPSQNPVTSTSALTVGCLVAFNALVNGIACPAFGNGIGGYVMWDMMPGIHFDGEYASWNDLVHGTSDSGWFANVTWDLGTLLGVGHNFFLQTGYQYSGQNFYPPYGGAPDDFLTGSMFPGNAQGFMAVITYDVWPGLTLRGEYYTGNNISNAQTITEWQAGFIWAFAPNTTIWVRMENNTIGGILQGILYRAELNYTF
jgi:hypothetical protein